MNRNEEGNGLVIILYPQTDPLVVSACNNETTFARRRVRKNKNVNVKLTAEIKKNVIF